MPQIIATIKLLTFLAIAIVLAFLQCFVLLLTGNRFTHTLPRILCRSVCAIFGIKIHVKGATPPAYNCFFAGNHISYLDIMVLGATIKGSFVAKSEVAGWPLFGQLAVLQKSIFITRSKQGTRDGSTQIQNRLNQGDNLIIFPEGTSTNGQQILPFKSSFFEPLLHVDKSVTIQPFTIELSFINGTEPKTQTDYDHYAWYGDMTLAPHLWNVAKLKSLGVTITFHDVIEPKDYTNRKDLMKKCEEAVAFPFKKNYDPDNLITQTDEN